MEDRTKVLSGEIFALADELKAKKTLKKELEDKVKKVGVEVEELDRQLSDAMTEVECSRWCSQSKLSHRNMQQICTEAIYDSVFLAYRVAIPRQRFSFRNVFST